MIRKIFILLLRRSGKTYDLDPAIPDSLVVHSLANRLIMMLRGLFWLRKKVFLGTGVQVLHKRNFSFGSGVTVERHTRLDGYASQKITLGNNCRIGAYSCLTCTSHMSKFGKGLSMGNNSAIGDYTHFGASGGIAIGDDVIMGSYISFHSENHNFTDTSRLIREQGVSSKGIILGNNIWVGAKVTFLDGSTIGNNCVVAAGAVVSGLFPDNCVIGGVPARILKTIEPAE